MTAARTSNGSTAGLDFPAMSTCYVIGIVGYCTAMALSSIGQVPVALLSVCAGAALAAALFIYKRGRAL